MNNQEIEQEITTLKDTYEKKRIAVKAKIGMAKRLQDFQDKLIEELGIEIKEIEAISDKADELHERLKEYE